MANRVYEKNHMSLLLLKLKGLSKKTVTLIGTTCLGQPVTRTMRTFMCNEI